MVIFLSDVLVRICSCTISKTRASVSSGYPNTEKQMKARGRRPSVFIVSRGLDTPMKHEARVLMVTFKEILNKGFQLELFAIYHSSHNFNINVFYRLN